MCSYPSGNTAQGLCDMGGNVFEWVEDDWHNNFWMSQVVRHQADGSAWINVPRGQSRIFRGGSYDDDAWPAFALRFGIRTLRRSTSVVPAFVLRGTRLSAQAPS